MEKPREASQQSILKASIKDDFYLQLLRGQLSIICRQFLGMYTCFLFFGRWF